MDDEDNIVARLRLYAQRQRETKSSVLGLLLSDSADEIERLHRDYSCICKEMLRMMDERDEARRNYCWAMSNGEEHKAINIARSREWDCFKENTNA
jgi:hypothetical protein